VFEVFLLSTSTDMAPYRAKVRDMVERLGEASSGHKQRESDDVHR
jgi:hypothetical protein